MAKGTSRPSHDPTYFPNSIAGDFILNSQISVESKAAEQVPLLTQGLAAVRNVSRNRDLIRASGAGVRGTHGGAFHHKHTR